VSVDAHLIPTSSLRSLIVTNGSTVQWPTGDVNLSGEAGHVPIAMGDGSVSMGVPDAANADTVDGLHAAAFAGASHGHAAGDINTGTLAHERGGLEFDASAITTGGLIVGSAAGTMALLASGSEDQVLTVQSDGSLAWETPSAGGGASSPLTLTSGGAAEVPLLIEAHGSQTADLQQWEGNAGTKVAQVEDDGKIVAKNFEATQDTTQSFIAGSSWFEEDRLYSGHSSFNITTQSGPTLFIKQWHATESDYGSHLYAGSSTDCSLIVVNDKVGVKASGYTSSAWLIECNGSDEIGFFDVTPVGQPTGYTTFANLSTDRTLDADSTTLAEVADVLGTLIEDLKSLGLIGA